jgi:release factor glutamine methyltransferase
MAGGTVTDEQSASYAALVARRVERIPLQHLTGLAPFRHLELHVGPGVFIPRPETELMVDHVRQFAAHRRSWPDGTGSRGSPVAPPQVAEDPRAAAGGLLVVDLCSGSGALALAIATELPGSRVIAVELSPEAAAWARRNIAGHAEQVTAAGSVLELLEADATRVAAPGGPLGGLRGTVDVVVTNPPYVPDAAIPREPEVRDHDPGLALYGGPDGLEVVRPLAEQAARLLRPGGLLLVEHADVQGEQAGETGVPLVLRSQPEPAEPEAAPPAGDPTNPEPDPRSTPAWAHVTDHLDLAGRPRHTAAIRAPGRMAP